MFLEEGLKAYDPFVGAQAYKAYMPWLSLYGSDAEAAAAFLVIFPAWGGNCGSMREALKRNYGFKADEVVFFDPSSESICGCDICYRCCFCHPSNKLTYPYQILNPSASILLLQKESLSVC